MKGKPATPAQWTGVAVFCLALAVRIAYVIDSTRQPFHGVPVFDSRYLIDQAKYLLVHWHYPPEVFFRPPLYTAWVAFNHLVGGANSGYFITVLMQHVVGALMCLTIYVMTLRLAGLGAAAAAGVIAALYSPMVFYEGELLSDSLSLFLNTLFLATWLRALDRRTAASFFLSGIIAGLAASTRPNIVLVVVAFTAVLVCRTHRDPEDSPRKRLGRAAAALAAFLMITALPTIHNVRCGEPVFIASQGGINFFIGNSEGADGVAIRIPKVIEVMSEYRDSVEQYATIGYLQSRFGDVDGLKRYYVGAATKPRVSEVSRYWYGEGRHWLAGHPREAAALYLRKGVALVNNFEVRNNKDYVFMKDHFSPVLRMLPFGFGAMFALACAGLAMCCIRRPRDMDPMRRMGWLVLFTAVTGLSIVTFFVAGRLRLSFVSALFPLAGFGAFGLVRFAGRRQFTALIGYAAIGLAAGFVSFYPWPQLDYRTSPDQAPGKGIRSSANPAREYSVLAAASLDAAKPDDAVALAAQAVAIDPHMSFAYLVAGNASMQTKRYGAAAKNFASVLRLEPEDTRALNNLGVACEKLDRLQVAADCYNAALAINPYAAGALGNLAILHARAGETTAAKELAARAAAIDPGLATVRVLSGKAPKSNQERELVEELAKPVSGIELNRRRAVDEILREAMRRVATP